MSKLKTIIPAQPGYYLITCFEEHADRPACAETDVGFSPIIAWSIEQAANGEIDSPKPISVFGEDTHNYGILFPNGNVETYAASYDTLQLFLDDMWKQK